MTRHLVEPATTGQNVLDTLMASRWSCRGYLPDPVPKAVITSILDTARRAPSWCNTQPWHLHIAEAEATNRFRAALAEHVGQAPAENPDIPFPEAYEGVYQERRRASGWQLYESVGIAKGDRVASARQMMRNFELFDAPHVAIVTTEAKLGTYGAVDCGVFVNSFLLAAHGHGVGAIPQAALASQAPFIREFFDIPEGRQVLLGISFGYPDVDHPINSYRTERQSSDEVVTWLAS
ncbi:nitroreductase [Rhodococcus wratislaviensis]|uniref:nitroreductase n=1 Tax=Rhodococcus wratislaviensis TaxID=44752 RepID=UPI003655B466